MLLLFTRWISLLSIYTLDFSVFTHLPSISRHSRHYPVKITIFGAFSSFTLLLKPLMDSLNNKSSEWIQNFNFIFIPAGV